MHHDIYFLLGGEDEDKRPRSKKLLQLIKKRTNSNYTLVVSGLSSFDPQAKLSESRRIADYLIQQGIQKKSIILEEKSLDTLGNIIFSYKKIKKLGKRKSIHNIFLITETFHLHRSRLLFEHVFAQLLQKKSIIPEYIGAGKEKSLPTQVKEFTILEVILFDIAQFQLKTYKDYKNYLYNLPVYTTLYSTKHRTRFQKSLYAQAIHYHLQQTV